MAVPLVYSKVSPGFSRGCSPTTPRPRTSCTPPPPSATPQERGDVRVRLGGGDLAVTSRAGATQEGDDVDVDRRAVPGSVIGADTPAVDVVEHAPEERVVPLHDLDPDDGAQAALLQPHLELTHQVLGLFVRQRIQQSVRTLADVADAL